MITYLKYSFYILLFFVNYSYAQSVIKIPLARGDILMDVPLNFYCRMTGKTGYFKSNKEWLPVNLPAENDGDFIIRINTWGGLTKEEAKACNLSAEANDVRETEKSLNYKMCVVKKFPSKSTKIFSNICEPGRTSDGGVIMHCDDNTVIDVDNGFVMNASGKFALYRAQAILLDMSACRKIE